MFTCKAGIRSASAAKLAQMAGYTDILDYAGKFRFATVNEFQSNHKCLSSFQPKGGSNEWFS